MATNNMHNLTTLIKRLEAATLRLEDIATSTIELPQAVPALSTSVASPPSASHGASQPKAASAAPTPAPPAAKAAPPEPVPESVEAFDDFINQSVDKYVQASNKVGGLVAEQATKVLDGFKEQRKFLLISTKAKKPNLTGSEMAVYQELLKPINEALMAVGNIKESNRGSPLFSQLSAVAEGIMVLAWVTVDNKPYKHVEESLSSAQYFGNKVLKEFKDKDPKQVEWVQAFYGVFRDLAEYVKDTFPSGVVWNANGISAAEAAKSITAGPAAAPPAPAPSAGGPPPPPPPPPGPPPVIDINSKDQGSSGGGQGTRGAMLADLNRGSDVTKGLRKVDKSEMTHKNPSLRASSTVPDGTVRGKSPVPGKKPKPESMRVKKPARKELEDNKWVIENYEKHAEPIEIEASINQSVLISKCNQTTVIVKGKANAVTIENTQRLSLVVDSLISTVDAVKSTNFALQVLGSIPTVMLDQIDGSQIYLSKDSTHTRVYSSKSTGINLNVISDEDEDYKEVPLPSQICSYYDEAKGDLVSEIVDHAG